MSTVSSPVDAIMDKYGLNSSSSKEASKSNDLGKDAFLNLLVTQMRYQDPLNPTSDKDFLAQMAQFSSLEQMQNLNTSSELSQGYALIGKIVTATVINETTLEQKEVEGFVDAVNYKSGKTYLVVDGQEVELSRVSKVTYVDFESATIESINKITETIKALQEQLKVLTDTDTDETTEDTADESTDSTTDETTNETTV